MKENYLAKWNLTEEKFIAKTNTSDVYLVRTSNQDRAALKLLSEIGKDDEAEGANTLSWYDGEGAVRVLKSDENAVLMEYADREELAALFFEKKFDEVTDIICEVVQKLHAERPHNPPKNLPSLKSRLDKIFSEAQHSKDPVILEAALIAEELLETTKEDIPLHGDLHHHNIMRSNRGWLAIDPKGISGDPCYDLANLYANPVDSFNLSGTQENVDRLTKAFADNLGYPQERISRFAYIHQIVSTLWSGGTSKFTQERLAMAKLIRNQF